MSESKPSPEPSRVQKAQAALFLTFLAVGVVLLVVTAASAGMSLYRQFVPAPQVSYVCHQVEGKATATDGPCARP